MLIEDVEKLINQLREEQGLSQEEARKEAIKRALEEMDNNPDFEREYDRPLGGCPAPRFDETEAGEPELEGDIIFPDEDEKPSKIRNFFGKIFGKNDKSDDDLDF